MEDKNIKQKLGISIWLNIGLIAIVVLGLFYVFLNAPTKYFVGSLFTRPQTIAVEDVDQTAFTIEYIDAFKTIEVASGATAVSIGKFNLRSTSEPIEAKSLNFVFESGGQESIKNLKLYVDGDLYKKIEFVWLDSVTLSLSFGAEPLLIEDIVNLDLQADLSKSDITMHFAFADLISQKTGKTITNQGIVSDIPDPQPYSVIVR